MVSVLIVSVTKVFVSMVCHHDDCVQGKYVSIVDDTLVTVSMVSVTMVTVHMVSVTVVTVAMVSCQG